jgi:microsomal dipeptidase-like Zn-dependent dipeptidase
MHARSRAVHDAAIIIDALQISNWSEAVFRNMRRGGLTAVNCTVNLTDALLTRGCTESEAMKILDENMVRLFKDVWNV